MLKFDICIIGAGPSGIAAAMRGWDLGKNVCLIEKGPIGGAGLHNGALSSKTLWELSKDYLHAGRQDRGYIAENIEIDFTRVAHCVDQAISEKMSQLTRQLDELSTAREEGNNPHGCITSLHGAAHFVDSKTVQVTSEQIMQRTTVTADYFIIATGSRPKIIDTIDIAGHFIMTSDHLMQSKRFPRSLVILGAGIVGCEFATIFANFGQTKVYLIDRADRILPFEDEDISRICSVNLEQKGVTIHHKARLLDMRVVDGEVEYTIQHDTGGRESIRVDHALISIGRRPSLDELSLDKTGIGLDERGCVVETSTQTIAPHIYAVGDVTAYTGLVNVGEISGRYAVEQMYGLVSKPLIFDNISTIMFLDPEVAAVGLNEQTAQAQRIPYRVSVYGYALVNRAVAMRATNGFVKLLVSDDEEMHVLGMRVLGVHASTTIEAISLMMYKACSVRDLVELLHPHPAVTEGVQECARMLLGTSIYKPQVFQSDLRLSRVTYDD